jgi:hypothetical protein
MCEKATDADAFCYKMLKKEKEGICGQIPFIACSDLALLL